MAGKINDSNKITAKDLINLGIFTVLYFIIVMAFAMLGFIPVFTPLLAVFCPLVGGIPFMLLLTRVHKFGIISIMGLLEGLLMLVGGMGPWAVLTGIVFGVLADIILRSGQYKSATKSVLSCGVFSMYMIGNFIPIVFNPQGYYDGLIAQGYGEEYAAKLLSYMPAWILPVLLIASFVCGILGGFIGKAMLKKHFSRAGIV